MEELAHKALVHNRHMLRPRAIRIRKRTPRQHRNLQRPEVVRRNVNQSRLHRSSSFLTIADLNAAIVQSALIRQTQPHRGILHPGNAQHRRSALVDQLPKRRRVMKPHVIQ